MARRQRTETSGLMMASREGGGKMAVWDENEDVLKKEIEAAQKETAQIKKQVKILSMICAVLVGLLTITSGRIRRRLR